MKNIQLNPLSLVAGSVATAGLFVLTSFQGTGSYINGDVREFLSHISMVDLPDGQGGFNRTVRISGINVQVVNGTGSTDGAVNGGGNLIVGYNELGNYYGDDRTGSHNIVVGNRNSFLSFGGWVAARQNTVSAPFASVTGGQYNTASGLQSSVSSGHGNSSSGVSSSVSSGVFNTASGDFASVSGGWNNTASGGGSSVSGGRDNTACGPYSSVSGGQWNVASGGSGFPNYLAGGSVSGGRNNTASGIYSSVSGGNSRSASNADDWAAGSLFEDD